MKSPGRSGGCLVSSPGVLESLSPLGEGRREYSSWWRKLSSGASPRRPWRSQGWVTCLPHLPHCAPASLRGLDSPPGGGVGQEELATGSTNPGLRGAKLNLVEAVHPLQNLKDSLPGNPGRGQVLLFTLELALPGLGPSSDKERSCQRQWKGASEGRPQLIFLWPFWEDGPPFTYNIVWVTETGSRPV